MTVAELIEELEKIEDKTQEVWADGCDCTNRVTTVNEEKADQFNDAAVVLGIGR